MLFSMFDTRMEHALLVDFSEPMRFLFPASLTPISPIVAALSPRVPDGGLGSGYCSLRAHHGHDDQVRLECSDWGPSASRKPLGTLKRSRRVRRGSRLHSTTPEGCFGRRLAFIPVKRHPNYNKCS